MFGPHIFITVSAPPIVSRDDRRPAAIVHGIERALPGQRLAWTVSAERQLVPLTELRARSDGSFPIACNGDGKYPVMVIAWSGSPLLEVHAHLPPDADGIAATSAVLEAIGDEARAFWGQAAPSAAALDIARQTDAGPLAVAPRPPRHGLPAIRLPQHMCSPEVPHRLGWWNYWSEAAARAIGFPDPARDAELLAHARRTAAGWVVPLTDAPLDLDRSEHLVALRQAYERFPAIGGRAL